MIFSSSKIISNITSSSSASSSSSVSRESVSSVLPIAKSHHNYHQGIDRAVICGAKPSQVMDSRRHLCWLMTFVLIEDICADWWPLCWLMAFVLIDGICADWRHLCWLKTFELIDAICADCIAGTHISRGTLSNFADLNCMYLYAWQNSVMITASFVCRTLVYLETVCVTCITLFPVIFFKVLILLWIFDISGITEKTWSWFI